MTATAVQGGSADEPGVGGAGHDGSALSGLTDEALLALVGPLLSGREGLSADECLDGIEAAHLLARRVEGARLHGAGELAARTGEELLARQDVADPAELSRTARDRWRARAKSVAAVEICALTGMGRGAARQLVAVALAPVSTRGPVRDALRAGVATWGQVEHFWRKASQLPHEDAGQVAQALFRTQETLRRGADAGADPDIGDAAPDLSSLAVERLDRDGNVCDAPWGAKQFVQAGACQDVCVSDVSHSGFTGGR
ncbi:hypothetical protein [Serinicoccus kebangsaanensis]|uniref:hypothetical protein n=1 Tax=Serinicoccus kebangsaanensis TaxID=2602069 RepID=UPI00192D6C01|nr:hypothetical protein [Serinicoccus kebangsaanensis]